MLTSRFMEILAQMAADGHRSRRFRRAMPAEVNLHPLRT